MSYYVDAFKNYFNFTGKADRKEFWCAYGINFLIEFVMSAIYYYALVSFYGEVFSLDMIVSPDYGKLYGHSALINIWAGIMLVYSLFALIPFLALTIRRLRDGGFPWWTYLLCLLGCFACGIGAIVLLVFLCMPTKYEPQAAPEPKVINVYNYNVPDPAPKQTKTEHFILGRGGLFQGKRFSLGQNYVIIGRDGQSSDVVINDTKVSRKHCQIRYNEERNAYELIDMSSVGTYVNETQVAKGTVVTCFPGDKIRLGQSENVFELQ